jgi:hypothetical protein
MIRFQTLARKIFSLSISVIHQAIAPGTRLLQLALLFQIRMPVMMLNAYGLLPKSYYLLMLLMNAFQAKSLLILKILLLAQLWEKQEFVMEIANIIPAKLSKRFLSINYNVYG